MAGKLKAAAPKQRATIGADELKWEQLPDGRVRWTHVPPKPEDFGAKQIPWRPIWCAGYDVDEQGQKHYHHLDGLPCHCEPGPQIWSIQSTAFEVACGGGRGSAKTEGTFGFLIKGNPIADPANASAVDVSYLRSPDYKFLVLRRNAKDLKDYFERAKKFFFYFGGEPTENPMGVRFPQWGSWGIFDHLADSDAYEKYQGQEFARIALEEAGQIPEEELYLKILMSCRSPRAELNPQTMLTFNPGGPGARWINARFVKILRANGMAVRPGEVYTEPHTGRTRVFFFSRVDDNPYLLARGYDKGLDLLRESQPTLYRRWRLGDFDAIEGQYFESFREKRRPNEPPEALHVIPARSLPPTWPRAISLDWGYSHKSAVMWGCWAPNEQLHVYREFVVSRMGTEELGAEIAKRSLDDLSKLPDPHLMLYLSHDAFHRTDETNTEAEQIKRGVELILGKDAAFVLSTNQEEEYLDDKVAWESVLRRQRETARRTNITIVNAGVTRRAASGNLLRGMLRWWPIADERGELNEELARKILLEEGALAWHEYTQKVEKRRSEVLPKILFHDCCPKVVASIMAMIESENNTEEPEKMDGDDSYDACLRAGTLVETDAGPVPIERIQRGDLVLTREGYKPVTEAGVTNWRATVYTVKFSDGRALTGTANHPVFVHGAGFVPLGQLRKGDAVLVCDESKPSFSTALNSAGIQIPNAPTYGITTGLEATIASAAWAHCIRRFGARLMERFQRAMTSTTLTRTRSITIPAIWSASHGLTTCANTGSSRLSVCARWERDISRSQKHGTHPRPEESGIGRTAFGRGPSGNRESLPAKSAESGFKAETPAVRESARATATKPFVAAAKQTMKRASARFAARISGAINTLRQNAAPCRVLACFAGGTAPVYNLTVAGQPEYFASGILVHNCTYLCNNFKFQQAQQSRGSFIADKIQALKQKHPELPVNSLIMANRAAEAAWEKRHVGGRGITIPRHAGPSSRRYAARVN